MGERLRLERQAKALLGHYEGTAAATTALAEYLGTLGLTEQQHDRIRVLVEQLVERTAFESTVHMRSSIASLLGGIVDAAAAGTPSPLKVVERASRPTPGVKKAR